MSNARLSYYPQMTNSQPAQKRPGSDGQKCPKVATHFLRIKHSFIRCTNSSNEYPGIYILFLSVSHFLSGWNSENNYFSFSFLSCCNVVPFFYRVTFLSCHGISVCVPPLTNHSVRHTANHRSPIGTSQITTHRSGGQRKSEPSKRRVGYRGSRYPAFNAGWS